MGSVEPLFHPPGALVMVRPTDVTVPSTNARLGNTPNVRHPPLPSSRV